MWGELLKGILEFFASLGRQFYQDRTKEKETQARVDSVKDALKIEREEDVTSDKAVYDYLNSWTRK